MANRKPLGVHSMNPAESAKAMARALEAAFRRELAEHAGALRRLEVAARCGALFAGPDGTPWGIA